jgi:hypothetical protein
VEHEQEEELSLEPDVSESEVLLELDVSESEE